jgi:alkyl hydroperoxide reductase subunit AhpF
MKCLRRTLDGKMFYSRFFERRRKQQKEKQNIVTLSHTMHRCGLSPDVTQAYLDGSIDAKEWVALANANSKEFQEFVDAAQRMGVPPELMNGYIFGEIEKDVFLKELEALMGDAVAAIAASLRTP